MKTSKNESGQALLGGLFFLILAASISLYYRDVLELIHNLYSETLKSRFNQIKLSSKDANILNEIAINNQNIMASLMSAQFAYISAIENGLTISYEQPYWQTYANLKKSDNKTSLSEESSATIQKSFETHALTSGRGLYTAEALAFKNQILILQLPIFIQEFFSQSSNAFAQCLALEIKDLELKKTSHYVKFLIPKTYDFGVIKKNCTLEHKNNKLRKLIPTQLTVLSSGEPDFIISFQEIETYYDNKKKFHYGISYVKPELAKEFIEALKYDVSSRLKPFRLKSTVRISHPDFSCINQEDDSFTVESDWNRTCQISNHRFLQSFFKPNWAALLTYQESGLKR